MERARNYVLNNKRVFGKDITNIDRRNKNNSICEKATLPTDFRTKSRSFDKKSVLELRDPIISYESQIVNYMLEIQKKQCKELTTFVTVDMRQILIDWLVDVSLSFELKDQTLYLALAYLNQYASLVEITKHDYQLVGIACLWIASKYEEIYPPRMQNYVQVTDCSYTVSELKAMEGKILLALDFNLNYTTPLQLLEALSDKWSHQSNGKLTRQSQRTLCMCKYIIELSLFEGIGKDFCMKTLVLSGLMLTDSVLKVKTDSQLIGKDQVEKESLMKCFKQMCVALQNVSKPNLKLRAIKKKYNSQKYMGVSRFRIEQK